jgi:hypothetical protein
MKPAELKLELGGLSVLVPNLLIGNALVCEAPAS